MGIKSGLAFQSAFIFGKRCKPIVHGVISYFNPGNLWRYATAQRGRVLPRQHSAKKIWLDAGRRSEPPAACKDRAHVLNQDGITRVAELPNEMVSTFKRIIEREGTYTLLDRSSSKIDDPAFEGVRPDYKFVHLEKDDLSEVDWGRVITPDILECVSHAAGMNMKVNWATLYRTFSRPMESLKGQGRYVSFDWHFDNPVFPRVIKLMILLTDVGSVDDGAFEIQRGTRYRTLLPSLGNSRLTFLSPVQSQIETFTGVPGSGALFDVAFAHRGGLTKTNDRDVLMFEFVPSGNSSSTIWADE